MFFKPMRTACAAIFLGMAAQAAAHPLPQTSITISNTGGDMVLTIAVPVPELNLALPKGAGLGDAPPDGPLPADATALLAEYFAAHLAVTSGDLPPLDMQLRSASIQDADSADTGHFDVAVLQFAAPFPMDIGIFPLTLAYDGVMHRVRNHSALVLWQRWDGETPLPMGQIGFDQKLGKTAPLVLNPAS